MPSLIAGLQSETRPQPSASRICLRARQELEDYDDDEVQAVLDRKWNSHGGKNHGVLYLIKWMHYGPKRNCWRHRDAIDPKYHHILDQYDVTWREEVDAKEKRVWPGPRKGHRAPGLPTTLWHHTRPRAVHCVLTRAIIAKLSPSHRAESLWAMSNSAGGREKCSGGGRAIAVRPLLSPPRAVRVRRKSLFFFFFFWCWLRAIFFGRKLRVEKKKKMLWHATYAVFCYATYA